MLARRKRVTAVLLTLCGAILGGSLVVGPATYADPDRDLARHLSAARVSVHRLYAQAERASERYNQAREELSAARGRLRGLRADVERQRHEVEIVHAQVVGMAVSQAQDLGVSTTGRLLLADDPDDFLSRLATVSAFQQQQSQQMAAFVAATRKLERSRESARREVADIARTKHHLAADKAEIDHKAANAQRLLRRLKERAAAEAAAASRARERRVAARNAAARQAAAVTSADPAPPTTQGLPASGGSGAAVGYALAQVGDGYVYGATGPSAFDCSGLTMMAWAQAGVGLPHSASGQLSSGTPVSQSELRPGDLVFYYSPVHHVGIYVGNGQIVHAANPSTGTRLDPVSSLPYAGAVRPG